MGVQGWLGTIPPSPAGAVNKSELAGRLFREGRIPRSGPGDLNMGEPMRHAVQL